MNKTMKQSRKMCRKKRGENERYKKRSRRREKGGKREQKGKGGRERQRETDIQRERENMNEYINESLLLRGFNKLLVHTVFICKDFHIVLLVIQKSSETQ